MGSPLRQDDVVDLLGERMRQAGVGGLPQNYALFHQAFCGGNETLKERLEELPYEPPQDILDALFAQYGAQSAYGSLVESAHGRVMSAVAEINQLLSRELEFLERYAQLLDATTSGIESKTIGREALQKIASILAKATSTTVKQSQDSAASMSSCSAELENIQNELQEYKRLADTDHLTQLENTRAFHRTIGGLYCDPRRVLQATLVVLDIDHFKNINDQHGHLVGDHVLKRVATVMRSKCGPNISLFRVGGEEFALVVEGRSAVATHEIVENICKAVAALSLDDIAPGLSTTISAGICSATDAGGPQDLYEKADRALYASKSQGRNRVTSYPLPVQSNREYRGRNWLLYQEN